MLKELDLNVFCTCSRTCCALCPPLVPQSTLKTCWGSRSSQRILGWRAETRQQPPTNTHLFPPQAFIPLLCLVHCFHGFQSTWLGTWKGANQIVWILGGCWPNAIIETSLWFDSLTVSPCQTTLRKQPPLQLIHYKKVLVHLIRTNMRKSAFESKCTEFDPLSRFHLWTEGLNTFYCRCELCFGSQWRTVTFRRRPPSCEAYECVNASLFVKCVA